MEQLKLSGNNLSKLGGTIGPAHYAICWALDVLAGSVRANLKPGMADELVNVGKGLLVHFVRGKLSKEEFLLKLDNFAKAFLKEDLKGLISDFNDITLWRHVLLYQQAIKLRYYSYRRGLTLVLKESMLDGTLDFRACTTIPIFTNGKSIPFKNPVFNLEKIEFRESEPAASRLPSFANCIALTSIDFSKAVNLKALPGHCFWNCGKLKTVILPDLEELGTSCFAFTAIEEISLPKTLKRIGSHAFDGAKHLKGIDMRGLGALQSVQNYAFRDCLSMETLYLPAQGCSLGTGVAQGGVSLKDVDLGGCKGVAPCAFMACSLLKSIKIGSKQLKLSKGAFRGCYSLQDVQILPRSSPLEICNGVFSETRLLAVDLSSAVFNIDRRYIPCLPESLKVLRLAEESVKLAVLNPGAQKRGKRGGRTRYKAKDCPVSILSRDSRGCKVVSDRKRYRAGVYEVLGRPSWLGRAYVTGEILDEFRQTFMLCCYGKKLRPVGGIPRELWYMVLGFL